MFLDIEALSLPISDENPSGTDPREDSSATSLYRQIKDARNTARTTERKAIFDDDGGKSALILWRPVLETGIEIITSQAKDLEVMAWILEALIRLHGIQGLAEGFTVLNNLIQSQFDTMYPLPDEDGMETKIGALTGLNGEGGEGTLLAPIRNVEITKGGSKEPFAFWQYLQALEADKIADDEQKESKIASLGFSLGDVQGCIRDSSADFYVNIKTQFEICISAFKAYNGVLSDKCSYDAPPNSNIRQLLEDMLGSIKHLAADKLIDDTVHEENSEDTTSESATSAPEGSGGRSGVATQSGAIKSRQDALKRLQDISDFFKKTEPHSPIPYSIEKIVRWGNMSLNELMTELIKDSDARERFSLITGLALEE